MQQRSRSLPRWLRPLGAALLAAPLCSSLALANDNSGPAHPLKASATGAPTLIGAVTYPGNTASGGALRHRIIATHEITGTVDDDGGNDYVCGTVWDEGNLVTQHCGISVPNGNTETLRYEFNFTGNINQSTPGVGVSTRDVTVANPTDQDVENAPRRGNELTAEPVLMADTLLVTNAISLNPSEVDVDAAIEVTGATNDDGNGNDAVCLGIWIQGGNYYWDCRHVPVGSTSLESYYPTIDFDMSGLSTEDVTVMFVDVNNINALPSAATDLNTVLTETAPIEVYEYTVTASADPVAGGNPTPNTQNIPWGSPVTIAPNPASGYAVDTSTVTTTCGTGSFNAAGTEYTIDAMPTDNCAVTFSYQQVTTYDLNVSVNLPAAATFTCAPNPVPEGQTATCTLDITDPGYVLDNFENCARIGSTLTCSVGPVDSSTPLDITANLRVRAPASAVPVPVNAPLMLIMLAGLLGFAAQRSRRLRK